VQSGGWNVRFVDWRGGTAARGVFSERAYKNSQQPYTGTYHLNAYISPIAIYRCPARADFGLRDKHIERIACLVYAGDMPICGLSLQAEKSAVCVAQKAKLRMERNKIFS